MSRERIPFTLPRNPDLLKKINDMCINIKTHHLLKISESDSEKYKSDINTLKNTNPIPTWEEVVKLLDEVYADINRDRFNPIKY